MEYFILWAGERYPGEATRDLEGGDWGGLEAGAFIDGEPIRSNVPVPVEVELSEDTRGNEEIPPLFVVPALVLRQDLVQALRESGVDNIDYYPAVLVDRQAGIRYENYAIGNVIGLVDAIDRQKSKLAPNSPPEMAMRFTEMIIDEQACRGLLLFRLMHRQNLVVVAEPVARRLQDKRFPYVHLIPPNKFA